MEQKWKRPIAGPGRGGASERTGLQGDVIHLDGGSGRLQIKGSCAHMYSEIFPCCLNYSLSVVSELRKMGELGRVCSLSCRWVPVRCQYFLSPPSSLTRQLTVGNTFAVC